MSELNKAVNWTPEPAHEHKPQHPRSRIAWTLWTAAVLLIVAWGVSTALGAAMRSWVDLALPAAAALILVSVVMGFRNVAYLEPMHVARDRIMNWRWVRWSRRHPPTA